MYDKSQLLKGILEGCILKLLLLKENHGYGIVSELNTLGLTDLKEGSVYPVLTRLEKKGCLSATLVPSDKGPSRKCYSLTPRGRQYYREFFDSWQELAALVNGLLDK